MNFVQQVQPHPFEAKPARGFVLGKFMPPTEGHRFLCEFARQYVQKLTILVCSLPDEPINGFLRYQWMREMFPDCEVKWCQEVLPQEPVGEDPEFWATWARVIREYGSRYGEPYQPDVIFASEPYGHKLAASVGARFVPCDISRTARDISATRIRAQPLANWSYIPNVVRPHFVKRVTMFGPESSGKSTLATELGKAFDTIVVPEYGRTYTEQFGTDVGAEDLIRIVQGHRASVAAAKRQANKVMFEDTDPIMSAVWADMLGVARDPWFDSFDDKADLYLLCGVDIPWEDDGTRYFPSEADRQRFYGLCKLELERRGCRYIEISGSLQSRRLQAIAAVSKTFGIEVAI